MKNTIVPVHALHQYRIDEVTPCPGSRPLLYPKGKIIKENNEPVTNARITIKGNNASVIANIPGLRPIF